MAMKFELTDAQEAKLKRFLARENKKILQGVFTGATHKFIITEHGIGYSIEVVHAFGKKLDLTDYSTRQNVI